MADQNVLIPVKLDAFIFNKPVCDSDKDRVKIAPITQPNYSFLRLGDGYLQADIMHHADLHNAWPAWKNSRFTDLGTGKPFRKRQGVYLHWTMPLVYRSGITETKPKASGVSGKLAGVTSAKQDETTPQFPNAPARWLVIRKISDLGSVQPEEARNFVKKVTCWVVESDRRWKMEELDDDVDLQVDVSPFIFATANDNPEIPNVPLDDQAEVFIGKKAPLKDWTEEGESKARVDLKLLSSSNQLFPDYQPHCSNVFSMVDNFEYAPGQYLTKVDASYYVIGWNWRLEKDLFYIEEGNQTPRRDTLSNLKMEIKGSQKNADEDVTEDMRTWLNSPKGTRSVCHGTIYDVKWNSEEAPANVPGDDYARLVNGTLPVSVGTTPLDALTTYAEAHKDIEQNPTIKRLEIIISKLEKFLLIKDDGVETQFEAKDLLYNWNYSRFEGGQRYYVAGGDDKPGSGAGLPDTTLTNLSDLNRHQALFDALSRRVKQLRWRMFSEWWKYCILGEQPKDDNTDKTREIVEQLDILIKDLENQALLVHAKIQDLTAANKNFLPGSRPTYYQQRDPTLLVGGVKSGWQPDYLETLKFRLDSQVQGSDTPFSLIGGEDWSDSIGQIEKVIPDLSKSMKSLINEFVLLETTRVKDPIGSIAKQSPLYHDQLEIDQDDNKQPIRGPWRDLWNDTQPWFPLFLEWEVEYAHLDYEKFWTLKQHDKTHAEPNTIHYVIKEDVDIQKELESIALKDRDYRRLSGRVLVLPQPSFSLEAKIRQFFDDTPALPPGTGLLAGDEEFIKSKLRQLGFISGPLAGFSSHLVTLEQGNHVKPILKKPDTGDLIVVPEALREKAGLDGGRLAKIGIESDVTPYGTSKKEPSNGVSIFKPVAHGQFKFTKLNIIDKFGQTITAIDPRPSKTPNKIWPCISDWYKPHPRPEFPNEPNVIEDDKDDPTRCEYIQVPPTIHQPCRLNGAFLVPQVGKKEAGRPPVEMVSGVFENPEIPGDPEEPGNPELPPPPPEPPFWRTTNEWDKPVWGWVVVNYANSGVQVFLPDGTFYREIRLGDASQGSVTSPAWLPFKKPKDPNFGNTYEMQQLSLLVAKLGCDKYLTEFVGMINSATVQLQAPPSAYSEFTSSLIGRPLALVNMGWSLELAANELSSQLVGDLAPEKWLLPSPITDKPSGPTIGRPTYQFEVKLGDKQRGFDGLVGYFQGKPSRECTFGDALHLDNFYSHYSGNDIRDPNLGKEEYKFLKIIDKGNYPVFESHYIPPESKSAIAYETAYNTELSKHTFGALVDPFSPIHAYSGILPVKEIVLPNWQWQTAIEKMKAFFHAGPVLVVQDVPPFDVSKELTADTPVKKVLKKDKNEIGVQLPSVSGDQWTWLQPYVPEPKLEPKPGDPTLAGDPICPPPPPNDDLNDPKESYMGLAIDALDMKSRLEEGPYTAIEGYLQLADAPSEQTS
ncbi:hypothetical protein AOL_s00078g611 [Orbilia oligospora ATCC 24927]|uniref:Uncharacterized protein n=1 Tax=Arthrobotrys oligospora (strain ATCC 24927 / CBS 115.81 / DSM 1491) TaxID=756982 RepID=G1XCG4_ARTOA|nr:hypothetical protein AOL_s00078g611 [Orbilia oligospora ATCC 24927]EGX49227.1 hypothetical protein AOL_s00078g611 [Orbilia oligospora ATCC 24927]